MRGYPTAEPTSCHQPARNMWNDVVSMWHPYLYLYGRADMGIYKSRGLLHV